MEYLTDLGLEVCPSMLEGIIRKREVVDGAAVDILQAGLGNERLVVLILPLGVSALFVLKLMKELAQRFRVITWESVGCPNHRGEFFLEKISLAFQMKVFNRLAGGERVEVVSWCQGAHTALACISTESNQVRTLCMIAPWHIVPADEESEFDKNVLPIFLGAARYSEEKLKKLYEVIRLTSTEVSVGSKANEGVPNLHLMSFEIFRRFCKCVQYAYSCAERTGAVFSDFHSAVPMLLVHARDDEYSHVRQSVLAKQMFGHIETRISETGGHFQIYDEPAYVAREITDFIDSIECKKNNSPQKSGNRKC